MCIEMIYLLDLTHTSNVDKIFFQNIKSNNN